MVEAAEKNDNIFALTADVTGSVKMGNFKAAYPERFIQCGIAEANMIGISAGLALSGKVPFASAFAGFISGRVYDQIRMTVAYSNLNVKIGASHSGITVGEDGATHQMMEDLGLMKMLPNMVVINPCDYNQTKMATIAAAEHVGPVYIRFGRPAVPNFTEENKPFVIGKAEVMQEGTDVTIFATGHLVFPALQAADMLRDTIDYLRSHITELGKAIEDGVPVFGYTYWGCIDCISASTSEMAKRYGFIYVDQDDEGRGTLKRYPKASFYWYQKMIASNGEDLD